MCDNCCATLREGFNDSGAYETAFIPDHAGVPSETHRSGWEHHNMADRVSIALFAFGSEWIELIFSTF